MHLYSWTMKSTGGAITVDGKNERGEDVKLRHIKFITPHCSIEIQPRKWWTKKPQRIVHAAYLVAVDRDGLEHILHTIG